MSYSVVEKRVFATTVKCDVCGKNERTVNEDKFQEGREILVQHYHWTLLDKFAICPQCWATYLDINKRYQDICAECWQIYEKVGKLVAEYPQTPQTIPGDPYENWGEDE